MGQWLPLVSGGVQVLLEKPCHFGIEGFMERRAIKARRIIANLRRFRFQYRTAGWQEVIMTGAINDMIFWWMRQSETYRLFTTGVRLVEIVCRTPELDRDFDIFQSAVEGETECRGCDDSCL